MVEAINENKNVWHVHNGINDRFRFSVILVTQVEWARK